MTRYPVGSGGEGIEGRGQLVGSGGQSIGWRYLGIGRRIEGGGGRTVVIFWDGGWIGRVGEWLARCPDGVIVVSGRELTESERGAQGWARVGAGAHFISSGKVPQGFATSADRFH